MKDLVGTFDLRRDKSSFIEEETGKEYKILKKDRGNALPNDKVIVREVPHLKFPNLVKVVSVVERDKTEFVGITDKRKKTCFVEVDRAGVDFYIQREFQNGVQDGDRVKIKLRGWSKNKRRPEAEIVEIFGQVGDHNAEMKSIIAKFGVDEDFPQEVLDQVDNIPFDLDEEEVKNNRIDMRDVFTFTIDPHSAKDFDDALSFEDLGKGWYRLGVHIADVTHYMKPNTPLDKEAYKRSTSIYLVDRVIPMLPKKLSNGVCSLRPDEDKYAFSYICEISEHGKIRKEKFARTAIHSNVRLNYQEAQEIIEGQRGKYDQQVEDAIEKLNPVAQALRRERFRGESIGFHSSQPRFILDENNKVVDIEKDEAHEAHHFIEDFMLLANRKVSKFLSNDPSFYRCHEEPDIDKLIEVKEFIERLGYRLSLSGGEKTKDSIREITDQIAGTPHETVIGTLLVRCMKKAYYSPHNIGHYGLGFEYYTHFTSPIRRMNDVYIHRLLHEKLSGKGRKMKVSKLEARANHISAREVYAANAQRESIAFKQAEWMSDKIGESFEAIVTDVKGFGILVELTESGCRGLIPKSYVEQEGFEIDEANFVAVGATSESNLTIGSVIKVECLSVDMQMRLIDFQLS